MMKILRFSVLLVGLTGLAGAVEARRPAAPERATTSRATSGELDAALTYVRTSWRTLVRSHKDLARAAEDPKFPTASGRWLVYVPASENLPEIRRTVEASMSPADRARVELRTLPAGVRSVPEPGLLYVPGPYVVPGGKYNETYGWDSFFILLGLLRDGEVSLAKSMTENQLYQIRNYGKVLNANRTYYLTRSHPPFIARMVLRVFERTGDRAWLARAWPDVEAQWAFYNRAPHLTPTGLSRYWDDSDQPASEVISSEKDAQGRTHYVRVKEYLRTHVIPGFDLARWYDRGRDELTPEFYRSDRSMRESGFDVSNRFGPFNCETIDILPVCLNALLFQMEEDMSRMAGLLDRPAEAARWRARASLRRLRIDRYLWDEAAGTYFDYNFRTGKRTRYPFATTFFPLWVGAASPHQAARVAANLPVLERPGGIVTSARASGMQWDAPFGWAPLQHAAVQGLRRYGYAEAADRITANWTSLVLKEFRQHGSMFEKYDVEARRSTVAAGLRFGYSSNEIGFGWTNAAFTDLYAELPDAHKAWVRELGGLPIPGQSGTPRSGTSRSAAR